MKLNRLIPRALSIMAAAAFAFTGVAVTTVTTAVPAHAASTPGGQIIRSEILSRAQYWVSQGYTYLNSSDKSTWRTGPDGPDRYRRDCSGLVSMVWHLPEGYYDTSVYESWIGSRITRLSSFDDLDAGDAVLRVNFKGLSDHVEVFARWKNAADHAQGAYFYSFNSTGETVRNPYANSSFGNLGFRSRSDITSNFEHAIHYNNTTDDPLPGSPSGGPAVVHEGFVSMFTRNAADGHIQETYLPGIGSPWYSQDISADAGTPASATKPVAVVHEGYTSVLTINASNGHLQETYLPRVGAAWVTQDLSAGAGTPAAANVTPAVVVHEGYTSVLTINASNGHLQETYLPRV
ncbi:hypothetical protein, partial [Acrocarpospora macrocephala]